MNSLRNKKRRETGRENSNLRRVHARNKTEAERENEEEIDK